MPPCVKTLDVRRFLKKGAAVDRTRADDGANPSLRYDPRRSCACRRVGEQKLHVLGARRFCVDRKLLPLPRSILRVISSSSSSLNSLGALRLLLSSRRVISARLRAGLWSVPAKMMSSISDPRIWRALLSPITQRRPSTMFDLPHPFGPTMPVMPASISTSAASAKDLKPVIFKVRKITGGYRRGSGKGFRTDHAP